MKIKAPKRENDIERGKLTGLLSHILRIRISTNHYAYVVGVYNLISICIRT